MNKYLRAGGLAGTAGTVCSVRRYKQLFAAVFSRALAGRSSAANWNRERKVSEFRLALKCLSASYTADAIL